MVRTFDEAPISVGMDGLCFERAGALDQPRDLFGLEARLLAAELVGIDLREVERDTERIGDRRDVRERGLGEVSAEDPLDGGFGDAAAAGEGGARKVRVRISRTWCV